MMQIWPTRLFLASGIAGLILLVSASRGETQFDEAPFAPAKTKDHLHFTTSLSAGDPFSGVNQAKDGKARRGEIVQVILTGTTTDGYYTYPLTRRAPNQDEGQLAKVEIKPGAMLVPLYPVLESDNAIWDNAGGKLDWMLEHKKPFTWAFEFFVKPEAPVGSTQEVVFTIKAQVCNASKCTVEDHVVKVSIPVGPEEPLTPPADIAARSKPVAPIVLPEPAGSTSPPPPEGNAGDKPAIGNKPPSGLLQAILIAVGGGFISLLTPCVFPMIPITVSYFLKQAESKKSNPLHGSPGSTASAVAEPKATSPLLMALVYSLTIVLILTVGGLSLGRVLIQISTHPVTNFALGGIFLFFGLSLFGWYDVTLPSWLQDATSSGEGRGGLLGVFFMALTFSIVSFSCVGPIYGIFIAGSASGATGQVQLVASVLAFAIAFASPFFFLALFPQLLKTMPRAGSWMNSVKVVMGFLEIAAVVKFLRAGELASTGAAEYLSYDLCLGIYVVLCIACGLYLLGVYRLPHDHEAPETVGVPRLLFSLGFLTLALYMTPGLFKTANGQSMQPRGIVFGWIDSFLLPDPESGSVEQARPGNTAALVWNSKMSVALAQARKENKLVFIDFTGTLCTNCKLNERFAFSRPEFQAAFAKHVLLKLYTDKTPAGIDQEPSEQASLELRDKRFETNALPHYAMLQPVGDDFRIIRAYDGNLIQTPGERQAFLEFLGK